MKFKEVITQATALINKGRLECALDLLMSHLKILDKKSKILLHHFSFRLASFKQKIILGFLTPEQIDAWENIFSFSLPNSLFRLKKNTYRN